MKIPALVFFASVLLGSVASSALADGGDVRIEGDRVVAELEVPAALEDVRKVVDDPWTISGFYGDGNNVTRVHDGDCDTLRYAIDSFIGTVTYNVLYCVDADGARSTLAEPLEDMRAYEAVWRVEASGTGSKIRYELLVVPTIKLPRRVVRSTSKRSVKKLFVRLEEELGG